ncbi:hypothetical protein [Pseudoxanthomonas sp. JBR18]|uniref:hypothetical protein n=1 Tax=Pseudoxanthomonas sp. JBR18 TaxID=2969308 RepID=UPI0023063985|nr:hypothetical protein [Pseudoxanthomonas sp. JBR18]WCE04918.1 hypothetical protein PJ250_02705 [Pseudoxanthomonas sp. JBR18]
MEVADRLKLSVRARDVSPYGHLVISLSSDRASTLVSTEKRTAEKVKTAISSLDLAPVAKSIYELAGAQIRDLRLIEGKGDIEKKWLSLSEAALSVIGDASQILAFINSIKSLEEVAPVSPDNDPALFKKMATITTALNMLSKSLELCAIYDRRYIKIDARLGIEVHGETKEGSSSTFSIIPF